MMQYDDDYEDEWVVDDNADDDSDADMLLCPVCHEAVHEDTQQCPHCGDYITPIYPQNRWGRAIWVIAAMLVIVAMIMMTL